MRTRPDTITTMELPSGTVELDGHGYLVDPTVWNKEFANAVADAEGIELTLLHWDVIGFMRDSYADHGVAVDVRHVNKFLGQQMGVSKNEGRRKLFELFFHFVNEFHHLFKDFTLNDFFSFFTSIFKLVIEIFFPHFF